MLTTEQVANVLLVLAVLLVLCVGGMGMWAVHKRRRYWEAYERERDARLNAIPSPPSRQQPTSDADDFGGFPG